MTGRTPRQLQQPGLLALLAIAEFMLTLDLSIVNVALPAIRHELAFSESSLEWVVNAYALAFAGFLLLGGRAADLFGGRRVFLSALAVFSAASLACGLASRSGLLVAARSVQGLSAGILAPATLSILTATYPDPREREKALSVWTAVAIGGGAVGSVLGGLLTTALSWRWIFFVNVPVGALLLTLAPARLPRAERSGQPRRLDLKGAATVTLGLVALVLGLARSNADGWGSAEVVASFLAAALLLAAFVVIEMRVAREPLVPLSVFRDRLFAAGNALSFLSFVPVMATWFFLTLYLQLVHRYTALDTGLAFLPMSLAVIAGSQVGFRVNARVGSRALLAAGALVAAGGLVWLARISPSTAVAWVVAPASLAMAGGGLMFAPITLAAMSLGPEDSGLASGLLNTTRQIGGALGLALLGAIAGGQTDGHALATGAGAVVGGFADAFEVGAVVFVATAALGVVALPGRRRLAPSTDGSAPGASVARAELGPGRRRPRAAAPEGQA